jgi:hypothetical protein
MSFPVKNEVEQQYEEVQAEGQAQKKFNFIESHQQMALKVSRL